MNTLLPSKPFHQAKAQLSDVMNEVVRSHHPFLVDRNRGKELMVLMSAGDLLQLLEGFSFSTQVSVSADEFVFHLPELNLVAGGESFNEGLDELLELAEEQAQLLMERFGFYAQTDRARQIPWALRIALTPPAERRGLLTPQPVAAAAEPRAATAAA